MHNTASPEFDSNALQQSEERYRILVNSIDEGFCLIEMIYDEQGQPIDWLYLEANPTFQRQTGIDPVGQRVSQVVGTVDVWWFTFYQQVLLSQTPAHTENQLSSLNRWYSIRAAPIQGYPHRLAVIFDDITQRRADQEALRTSEEHFRLLMMASSDSLYRMSADWSQMLNLKGMSFLTDTQQANAQWLTRYIPEEDQPKVQQVIHQAIQAKRPFELEHQVIRADGSVGWTLSRAIPLLDEQGEIREWFGAASDITDRKRAEQALQQADQRKDEFLAMLAHELRNPMATLHNTLLLLGLTQGQDETLPLEQALAMMSREVTHLNRMVDDLLDVSRISQGKIHLQKGRLALDGLIRDAVEAARSQFTHLAHTLIIQLPTEPIWVDGDPTRLTQVVRNLLTNAAKYTPPGGQISVQLEEEAGQAVLRIRDTGIGLAAEQLGAIFEVFVQVSSSLDRPQGGLGLGLAVVKQLVELHGGQVGVQSRGLGQGSEFTIQLPALPDTAASTSSTGPGEGRAKQSGRILVVDDNADLALTTALLLRVKKYEAHTCLSGQEALRVVASLQPDAVLLDLGMPGMDGYEACRRLRALDWGQQGVIVALSGYGEEADKKRTQATGFDGHLVKPIHLPTLTALLDQLLRGAKSGLRRRV